METQYQEALTHQPLELDAAAGGGEAAIRLRQLAQQLHEAEVGTWWRCCLAVNRCSCMMPGWDPDLYCTADLILRSFPLLNADSCSTAWSSPADLRPPPHHTNTPILRLQLQYDLRQDEHKERQAELKRIADRLKELKAAPRVGCGWWLGGLWVVAGRGAAAHCSPTARTESSRGCATWVGG